MANFDELATLNVIENIENVENKPRQQFMGEDAFRLSDFNVIKLFWLTKEDLEEWEIILTLFIPQRNDNVKMH